MKKEGESFELSFPLFDDNTGDTSCPLTKACDADDDDDEEYDNEFVFDIDESVLVDHRSVLLQKMIGEGSYSIVYKGLWVLALFVLVFLKKLLTDFIFLISRSIVTLCACMFLNFHVLCSRSVCFCFVFSFKANLAVNSGFFFFCVNQFVLNCDVCSI